VLFFASIKVKPPLERHRENRGRFTRHIRTPAAFTLGFSNLCVFSPSRCRHVGSCNVTCCCRPRNAFNFVREKRHARVSRRAIKRLGTLNDAISFQLQIDVIIIKPNSIALHIKHPKPAQLMKTRRFNLQRF